MPYVLNPLLDLPAPLAVGISPGTADLLCLGVTGSYVGSLYLAQLLFGKKPTGQEVYSYPPPGHRDHPDTMKLRMSAVQVATGIAVLGVCLAVKREGHYSWKDAVSRATEYLLLTRQVFRTARLLGLSSAALNVPLAYVLAPALMLGPLYACYLDQVLPGMKNFGTFQFGLEQKRNYVIGPITEELVFRSCILSVCFLAKMSITRLIFVTPLWFGIAHAHHVYQRWKDGGCTRYAASQSLMQGLFQFSYTTLFGWFASYTVLRTGSVLPALTSHIFCNYMGIYPPNIAAQRHPKKKLAIYSAYFAGLAAFAYGITKL